MQRRGVSWGVSQVRARVGVVNTYQPGIGVIGCGRGRGSAQQLGRGRGRSSCPYVGPLTHSRKLDDSSKEPAPDSGTPPTLTLTFTPTLEFVCKRLCPTNSNSNSNSHITTTQTTATTTTTTPDSPLLQQRSRPRRPLVLNTRFRFHSQQARATSSSRRLPIMAYEGKWTALAVRKTFLEYFAERGHTIGTIQ